MEISVEILRLDGDSFTILIFSPISEDVRMQQKRHIFPMAFAMNPSCASLAVARGARAEEDTLLAWCAVFHKVGLCQDDVKRSRFFYI